MAVSEKDRESRKKRQSTNPIPSSNGIPNQFNPNLVPALGEKPSEGFLLVPLDKLRTFQSKGNGDFTPLNEEELQQMADTMDEHGPNEPIIVREIEDRNFEILSGEQRFRASKLKGLTRIRAIIVRNCDEKKAKHIFLISNLARRKDRIRDKIYGWKQFFELNSGHVNEALKEANIKDSFSALSIYVKCADLTSELISCVDSGKLSLKAGYQLSFLTSYEQKYLLTYAANSKIMETDAREIRKYSEKNTLTEEWLIQYFGMEDSKDTPVSQPETPTLNASSAATSFSSQIMTEQRELALKKRAIYDRSIRTGMRKIRSDIIGRVSPHYYDNLADIIAEALDLYLEQHSEYGISETDIQDLQRLDDEIKTSSENP